MLSIEESFVQKISENPPESTANLEARMQEAIEAGSIHGFRLLDEKVILSTPFAQDEPTLRTPPRQITSTGEIEQSFR